MSLLAQLLTLSITLTLVTACTRVAQSANGGPPSAVPPDPDAVTLASLGQQAAQRARQVAPEVVLRQVDTDRRTTIFRFTDRAVSQEITVRIGAPGEPPDQWRTTVTTISPLVGHVAPELELQHLNVGPQRVATTIATHWPTCQLQTVMLYRDANDLRWRAFCATPQRVVAGTMDNQTGVFEPEEVSPAPVPATATPMT